MDRYQYYLNKETQKKIEYQFYNRDELTFMTTHQLREICRKERIINGLLDPMDKDELIRQIMRFRGREERLLIKEQVEGGFSRLKELLDQIRVHKVKNNMQGCAKVTAYHDIGIDYLDRYTISYYEEIADTNALLVSEGKLCAIFNLCTLNNQLDKLYILKSKGLTCQEAEVKNYTLYCLGRKHSDFIYKYYSGEAVHIPENLTVYPLQIVNFEIKPLLEPNMPLAIDFGTSNTTAGMYLDNWYFEQLGNDTTSQHLIQNGINYVLHLDNENNYVQTPVLPSVVGVTGIINNEIQYVFGYQANRLFKMSYIDEGFSVFYDIKRWINDADKQEEIVAPDGRRAYIKRKEIIKAYLIHIIEMAKQRFKCNIREIHISSPVKQKPLFLRLFQEILHEYTLETKYVLDEGVAVLYNSISNLILQNKFRNGQQYRALIIDCGGGTTDLSSCSFTIDNQRVSYKIDIQTAYENGDTDFGGNNLTYRIMQLLKIAISKQLSTKEDQFNATEILKNFNSDIFREVDNHGVRAVYEALEDAYQRAEQIIPTKYKQYEHQNTKDYYRVKNNFYYLYDLAEQIKKNFYNQTDILRMVVSTIQINEAATKCLLADKWKLSKWGGNSLEMMKDIPTIYISVYEINLLLRADIYGIVSKFMEQPYKSRALQTYSIIRLTGQSCKIDIFREALKEFIPGRIIEATRKEASLSGSSELKLICLDGAIQYLKDRRFGYADINIESRQAAFPYIITAYTHTGEEKTLIHSLNREKTKGIISRNLENLTLKLFLKDTNNRQRYSYNCSCNIKLFEEITYEGIYEKYGSLIPQDDVDDIVDKEVKFFIYADDAKWGFNVVPILRRGGQIALGPDQFFMFENEGWLTNFFDGTK